MRAVNDHIHVACTTGQENEGHNGYWWCSVCDDTREEGKQFCGMMIVQGDGLLDAYNNLHKAHAFDGGGTEVLAAPIPHDLWEKTKEMLAYRVGTLQGKYETDYLMKRLDNWPSDSDVV